MNQLEDKLPKQATKELILDKSLEMINQCGMLDFRIDELAVSLGLSPGNVTYHFAKKEDISIALWEKYVEKMEEVSFRVTKLLDIKQLYLLFRALCMYTYQMRGIVMFAGGDIRVIGDSKYNNAKVQGEISDQLKKIVSILDQNNFINKSDPDANQAVIDKYMDSYREILLRWWVNKECVKDDKNKDVASIINYNALLLLYTLYPLFNENGQKEFDFISESVLSSQIDIS